MTKLIITAAELHEIAADENHWAHNYLWNDGAFTWDIRNLSDEIGDEMLLGMGTESTLELEAIEKSSQIIVVDLDNFTAKYHAPTEFIEEFAKSAPTRNGVERVYQFDEDQMAIIDMRTGSIARKVEGEADANGWLLHWALWDVSEECDRSIEAFVSKENAIEFLDEMIENYECEENDEAVAKCKAMKEAL